MNEMDFENRIVSTEFTESDSDLEKNLRTISVSKR